ncbi:hypothetical protein JRO89_XSUnG0074400 [Xanthoceras sorbifolium]|uniref:3-beta hydroxysteroid dehydrogenase/isomerase domain-containing protein n=1 Tax=Xanthoceras sorbifolium TaxID=99658 RepID=A0ABQ8GZL4_9ROSI|nr:hypothetical protein JRO89_XSUnG0074400 [Xanthoceras sorbifolium]
MTSEFTGPKTACVVGGTGFVASLLIKQLLLKGYAVNTTVRDPENEKKIPHLKALQELGELKIFAADLTNEGSFDAPVVGCDIVFHVATPVNFASEDPENDMIKPAIKGALNVLKACAKAKSVKRVIMTSSAAAVSINTLSGTGLVMDEKCWSDVEFLTRNEFLINAIKGMQLLSGSFSITHVEDVCRAHIFVAEKETASGRYICAAVNTSVPEVAEFLSKRYPQYKIPTDFGDFPTKAKVALSSEKLISEGFSFKYGIEETYDQTVEYLKTKGVLK